MKKIVFTFFIACLTIVVYAQEVTVRQADLERRKYKTGAMILYYGENRLVSYCSVWNVTFKIDDSEEKIAESLKARVGASRPYIYFEFKEGYDCNNATGYLQKKGISKMNISSCTQASFTDNTTSAGNSNAESTKNKIREVALLLNPRYRELKNQGWTEVSSVLTNMGGIRDGIGEKQVFKTGYAYKILTAAIGTQTSMVIYNRDVVGRPPLLYASLFGSGTVAETPMLHFTYDINDVDPYAVAFISREKGPDNENKYPAGMIVMQKPYSLIDELKSVLNEASENFIKMNGYRITDVLRLGISRSDFSLNVLGTMQPPSITKNADSTFDYSFISYKADEGFAELETKILNALNEFKKAEGYSLDIDKDGSRSVYRLLDKERKQPIIMIVRPENISIMFKGAKQ